LQTYKTSILGIETQQELLTEMIQEAAQTGKTGEKHIIGIAHRDDSGRDRRHESTECKLHPINAIFA
jgi:hypothetical protein